MILAGFAAAGSWRPGVSFKPVAPTQLSSCLSESWEAVSARKELQIEEVLSVFDQKLAISVFSSDTPSEHIVFQRLCILCKLL